MAIGFLLGTIICQPHICGCGTMVDARGLRSLACPKSAPCHIRHSQINDLIWRAIKKAQIPANKEPIGLSRNDGERPDGAPLVPWSHGKPLAWDVTVPDTYAASHIQATATSAAPPLKRLRTTKGSSTMIWRPPIYLYPSLWRRVAHGALNLLNLLKISEGESLQSPMNPLRRLTFTRGFRCHYNKAM